ncbi:MAG: hypothetical protein NTZ72_09090 [Afipia sp.]|nr:hypothetical protein [Afipia sp.]
MTASNNGWSSNFDNDFSASPQTTDDYEFNQRGKPAKAVIGLGILVAFGLALTFFHPANHDASTSSAMVRDSAHANAVNNAPAHTIGQAPSTSAK